MLLFCPDKNISPVLLLNTQQRGAKPRFFGALFPGLTHVTLTHRGALTNRDFSHDLIAPHTNSRATQDGCKLTKGVVANW